MELLRFGREGKPVPFKATGTNALFVDHTMQANFWHDVYHGMDVDRHGNIYYVAKGLDRNFVQRLQAELDTNLQTRGGELPDEVLF